ncbi:hypothetical protein EYC80_004929 [Monilinia laxa]|uniref:Uncharacterized protein n=1 Tax=Monilinia laxa TaxID=61186 RepID=A0A5N6KIM4_MONLA|nr:hypothetical protein EYC80_004929 [Monilinia laxa]
MLFPFFPFFLIYSSIYCGWMVHTGYGYDIRRKSCAYDEGGMGNFEFYVDTGTDATVKWHALSFTPTYVCIIMEFL